MDMNTYAPLELTSTAFEHGDMLPNAYTCDGEDMLPPLRISNLPSGAKSLVFLMEDPDAPNGTWVHWLAWNVPVTQSTLAPGEDKVGVLGKTSSGELGYHGACPPPPTGEHRYIFQVFALDSMLELAEGASMEELEEAMDGKVVAEAELMGRYSRGGA